MKPIKKFLIYHVDSWLPVLFLSTQWWFRVLTAINWVVFWLISIHIVLRCRALNLKRLKFQIDISFLKLYFFVFFMDIIILEADLQRVQSVSVNFAKWLHCCVLAWNVHSVTIIFLVCLQARVIDGVLLGWLGSFRFISYYFCIWRRIYWLMHFYFLSF